MTNWDDRIDRATKSPASIFGASLKVALLIMAFGVIIGGVGWGVGWFSDVAAVAKQEFRPQAMLRKYEWFKDAAAQLSKKQADIQVYRARMAPLADNKALTRTTQEKLMTWQQELAGVTASYNGLAAEWNAQISKFNWRPFAAQMPPGAEQVLTTEFAPYAYQ